MNECVYLCFVIFVDHCHNIPQPGDRSQSVSHKRVLFGFLRRSHTYISYVLGFKCAYVHTFQTYVGNNCTNVHLITFLHSYIHTYIHTYLQTYTHTYTHIHTSIHTYIHTNVHLYTYISYHMTGFIVYIPKFPSWLGSWAPYVSFMRFSFQALTLNEFQDNSALPLASSYIGMYVCRCQVLLPSVRKIKFMYVYMYRYACCQL